MATERIGRRLAAIVAADVAGYSRLMGLDEVGTARTLREHRAVTDGLVERHGGRLVKSTGDGVLLEFPSVVDAVECAIAVQAVMKQRNASVPPDRRMLLRIGINLGDILIEGDDILGDGVNIAARLEGIAEPGGICISGSAYDQVRGKVEVEFADLGEQKLKNISRPVRAYAAESSAGPKTNAPAPSVHADVSNRLPLPDRPSIAVLPFQNMSGDVEQEYFADGMVEDITTALSRFKSLFVIARNSSFTYKGRVVDIKQVGRELGVRYVLEGSVRRSAGRIRITGQLIDSETGAHLWADRFDGSTEDVFDLQDRVTASVVAQLFSSVQSEEEARANRKPTENMDAYDHYLRAVSTGRKLTGKDSETALILLTKAIELDDNFALAHAMLGNVCTFRKQMRLCGSDEAAKAVYHARRSLDLGRDDALVLVMAGFALAYMGDEVKFGADCVARGLSMNPNLAWGWLYSGWVNSYLGAGEVALEHLAQAARLSPRERPMQIKLASALAHFVAERYDETIRLTEMITSEFPAMLGAWRLKAISYGMSGDIASAMNAGRKILELDPAARASLEVNLIPLQRLGDRERFKQGLITAGIPE